MSTRFKMSQSEIEAWSQEDVHRWLITEVKVSQSCADKFIKEEVSGEFLIFFKKTDIVDLGIKHGPAVKISCYVENLTKGSGHRSEYPAYVNTWTKEQVSQWFLQHVKLYRKYVEQLLEEDVSGDCLVCFKKEDFLDLGMKPGPALKIIAELKKLNDRPEPSLELPMNLREGDDVSLPQTLGNAQPNSTKTTESKPPSEKTSTQSEVETTKREALGATHKTAQVKLHPESSKSAVMIKNFLENLGVEDFKTFQFHLLKCKNDENKSIPLGTLENKDRVDTAQLLTSHFGTQKALHVTIDILKEIGQCELALQLERNTGQPEQCLSRNYKKTEANQGEKLKMLLTCGGNSLDSYARFVVVVNKSRQEQIQYLNFLSKLELFCVLDFDPNSLTSGGLCNTYRESRVANLHLPVQFQGQIEAVKKDLNLNLQTSWVFCNGRNDLEGNKELEYREWLRKSCKDVEQLVSFICNPDVFLDGRWLIIFLLLSPVCTEKDPVFDTYTSFIKHTDEKNIICICESQATYLKWRELIQEKCDFDIEHLSINELTLSEINGTIMGLGPVTQSCTRLLPSSGSSAVVLKQKDEDLLTALKVLASNECENVFDESSSEFQAFRIKVEEDFYRGAKVRWWNFYFCDKDTEKPFIKREKHEIVKKMIRSQKTHSSNACVLLNLFHHPGCGGTTLAMHAMWELRKEFRCAILKDNMLPKTEVANQIQHLMKLESEKPSPVLLLIDESKETETPSDLLNCIRQADLLDLNLDEGQHCKVIILNCVRSHNPTEQYRQHNQTQNQYITAKLTSQEQKNFEKKLKDLQETHQKPENFYSFMFMKNNFDETYTKNLARNTLEHFDFSTKVAQLFSFLALLKTYAGESEIALSLCEDFLQMKMIRREEDCVLDRMSPYSNFLIIDSVNDWGGYKGIRILHYAIASACLDELERSHNLKVSDIVKEILHCNLFFSAGVVKHKFMLSIQQMLIKRRKRKKDGDEREPFSPLIEKIHSQEGRQTVQEIFESASSRFEMSASIPQALARYLYINVHDFPEALKWAEKAKDIKNNPYTFDTIGQIHKSNLKSNIDREKQENTHNPEDLHKNIEIAINGWRAFQRAQELSDFENERQEETADDESEDYPRKWYNVYGHVSMLEISFLIFEILSRLPFFEKHDRSKKDYLRSFLNKTIPINSVYRENTDINNRYVEIISEHEPFLIKLKTEVKEKFDFLNSYFAYIKQNSEYDKTNHRTVSELFKKYVDLFCATLDERRKEQKVKTNLNQKLDIEERKRFLEMCQADTFSGVLQCLDKPAEDTEEITECYSLLLKNMVHERNHSKIKINYIMSNINLYHLNAKSKHVKKYSDLCTLLRDILQDVGLRHPYPDPYFLALLLFWPSPSEENTDVGKYVTAIRHFSHKHLSKLLKKRSTIAYFYLGKGEGLERLVSKPSLDERFLMKMNRDVLAQLWRDGDIFKEKAIKNRLYRVNGTIQQGEVYANYGKQKILVRPARIAGIRSGFSTEKVSFYIGFAINGPLAYDIKYEN